MPFLRIRQCGRWCGSGGLRRAPAAILPSPAVPRQPRRQRLTSGCRAPPRPAPPTTPHHQPPSACRWLPPRPHGAAAQGRGRVGGGRVVDGVGWAGSGGPRCCPAPPRTSCSAPNVDRSPRLNDLCFRLQIRAVAEVASVKPRQPSHITRTAYGSGGNPAVAAAGAAAGGAPAQPRSIALAAAAGQLPAIGGVKAYLLRHSELGAGQQRSRFSAGLPGALKADRTAIAGERGSETAQSAFCKEEATRPGRRGWARASYLAASVML